MSGERRFRLIVEYTPRFGLKTLESEREIVLTEENCLEAAELVGYCSVDINNISLEEVQE